MADRFLARTENKGSAEIRAWELGENSTRYDYLLAAPSDEQLTKYWTAWATISLFGGSFVFLFLFAILSSRNARSRAFNLYIIYLMIPDAVYSFLCGVVCLLHALHGSQVASVCNFQMMFIVWGVGSNMYLNAAVSHEVYQLLSDSVNRRKYVVPSSKYVTRQALVIYVFTLFLGSWGLIEGQSFPHYVASVSGLACLPVELDWKSTVFFWMVFFPLFGGLPIAYIHYICYQIWKRNLMPPAGKRRLLAVYFGRIVVVFVLMWVPYMILVFMFSTWVPTWVHFYGGTLSHLQGVASAILCLYKPDIYCAVRNFVTCRSSLCGNDNVPEDHHVLNGGESSSWLAQWAPHVSRAFRLSVSGRFSTNTTEGNNSPEEPSSPKAAKGVVTENEDSVLPVESSDDDEMMLGSSVWPNEHGFYHRNTSEPNQEPDLHNDNGMVTEQGFDGMEKA